MSVNKNTSKELIERGLILESDLADGALGTIFGPVKANLKTFGTILQDSAKLIGGDIAYLVKITFGRLKSLEDQVRMKREHNRRRHGYLSSISKNSDALMDSWPDGKITAMLIAPGMFFTNTTLSGIDKITSSEFRNEIGTYGLNQVFPLNYLFGGDSDIEARVLQDISRCEPGDGKCYDRIMKGLLDSPAPDEGGTLSKLALQINKIFLFANHDMGGELVLEGEEDQSGTYTELDEEQFDAYKQRIKQEIDKSLAEKRKKWLEKELKYFDKIVIEASNVIAINATLASTQDSKEFFSTLEKLKTTAGDDMKDLDIAKLESTFVDIGKKIKDDKDAMEKIKKSFEDEKIEETEENITKKLEEITLSSFKGTFLQELRESLSDYYEHVHTLITGGISADHKKILIKDELGKEYFTAVDLYEKKLKDALSNLK